MNKEEFIAEAIEYILDDPYDCDEHTCSLIQVQDADDLHDLLLRWYEDDRYDEFVKCIEEITDDDIQHINDTIEDECYDQRAEDMRTYYSMIGI